jgi:8-oxo-dGTP pyrophosphatase MutT (NUDIX family)
MSRPLRFYIFWPGLFLYFLINNHRTRVIVRCRGEILLVRDSVRYGSDPTTWTLPGGGIKPGEEDTVAATREIYEELGVVTEPDSLTLLGERVISSQGLRYMAQYFLVDIIRRPDLVLDKRELSAADWFTIADAKNLAMKPELAAGLALLSAKK